MHAVIMHAVTLHARYKLGQTLMGCGDETA